MAITTAQTLVRTERRDRLLRLVETYLGRWAKSVSDEWPDVPFVGRETSRNTFVLPPLAGWCCLLDPDRYRVDAELAAHVSKTLDTTVVTLELRGGEHSVNCVAYEGGVVAREDREPEEAFGPVPPSGEGPMPIYPDATLEATRALSVEGVPQAYWLLAQDDLAESAEADGPDTVWLDEIVAHPERKRLVERRLRAPYRLGSTPGRTPVPPDIDTSRADHRRVFVEIRSLWGRPDHQAIDNLLELQRVDRNRLLEPFFGEPETRVPIVRFEYTSRGVPDDELSAMLERRRASFLKARPTKMAFILDAVMIAKAEHPDWDDLRVDGFGLRFEVGGVEESIDLSLPYGEFMEGRLPAETPEAAISKFLKSADYDLAGARQVAEFRAIRNLLLPLLVRSDEAARLEANGVTSRAIGHGVAVVVTCQVGEGSAFIETDDLSRWGAGLDEALGAATANLDRRVQLEAAAFTPVEIAPGRKALASLSTEEPASLLVAPGTAKALCEILHAEDVRCAIPDRFSFFAIAAGDAELEAALASFARERMFAADEPLASGLFRLSDRGVEEA